MTLIILTVVVIASLIAVLAVYLSVIGVLLNRIADNLDDCLGNVKTIAGQADVVIPGVERINQTGQVVAAALPLLVEGAEGVTVKLTPQQQTPLNGSPMAVPTGAGVLDAMQPAPSKTVLHTPDKQLVAGVKSGSDLHDSHSRH